ncbi:hypothetical protein SCOR_20935 [Sulfidibacter corallicola]
MSGWQPNLQPRRLSKHAGTLDLRRFESFGRGFAPALRLELGARIPGR